MSGNHWNQDTAYQTNPQWNAGDFNRTDLWDDHQLRNLSAFTSLKKMVLILSSKNGSYVVAKKIRKNDFDSFTEFISYMFVQLLKNQSYQLSAFPKYKSEAVSLSVQWKTQAIPLNHDGRKGESFLKLNMKRDFFRRVNIELSLNLLPIFWKLVF